MVDRMIGFQRGVGGCRRWESFFSARREGAAQVEIHIMGIRYWVVRLMEMGDRQGDENERNGYKHRVRRKAVKSTAQKSMFLLMSRCSRA